MGWLRKQAQAQPGMLLHCSPSQGPKDSGKEGSAMDRTSESVPSRLLHLLHVQEEVVQGKNIHGLMGSH